MENKESKFEELHGNATLPQRATNLSAGYDLHSNMSGKIEPGRRLLVTTGITVILQPLEQAEIRPRSGLAHKHGVTVINSPGTVDADYYPNEIKVLLINHGEDVFYFNEGDRIAQVVITAYKVLANDEPGEIKRTDGFGHTGR